MHPLARMPRRRLLPPSASAWGAKTPPAAAASAASAATRNGTSIIRRWSSSGFAAGDHTGAAEMPSLPSAFPWREAPDMSIRGLFERAVYSYLQHQHRRFLRVAMRPSDSDDETFLRAAEMAFVQVAAGAFQMPAHHVMAPLVGGEESGRRASSTTGEARDRRRERTPLWDVPEGVVVDPRDVMHKDLADFYMQAVVATKLSRCTPFYRLHGFGECRVSNINVLWGAQRGDLPEGGETIELWGSKYHWHSIQEDLRALSRHLLLNDRTKKLDSHRLSSLRKTTLQVDVDIGCTETFFVSDDRTEEVVQGSKAVGVSKHRLRLECSPFFKRDFQWVVVDVDNWMKGNTFW